MSLRSRLLFGLTVVAVVLVGAALFVARSTETYLIAQIDEQLANVAGRFPVGTRPIGPDGAQTTPQLPQGERLPQQQTGEPQQLSPLYVGVLSQDGQVVTIFAPNLANPAMATPIVDPATAAANANGAPFFAQSTTGSRYRVQTRTNSSVGSIAIVALPMDNTDAAISRLIAVEAVATLIALGVLGMVAWWVIRLGVRPVKQMADTAAAIAGGDLSSRVPEGDPRTEAGELGIALNQMLGRIEESFDERARTEERLRRFVADASHELRTPVTTIRGYADLYRHGGLRDDQELDDAMRRTEQEAARMGALVEDMLQLARLDQGRPLRFEPVDLAALARDAVADARVVDPTRPIQLDAPSAVIVTGDEDRLRQVLANLIGNALVHTPPDTPVTVRVAERGADAVLEVRDRGPGMSGDVAEHVFERFYRADVSRSRARGGTGLGLAIVEAIVVAHAGRISLESQPGQGTVATVIVPAGAHDHPPLAAPEPKVWDSRPTLDQLSGSSQVDR